MAVDKRVVRIEFEGADHVTPEAKKAQASVRDLVSALESVKTVLGAIGVTVGAGALLNLYHDSLKATAQLGDLAQQAGTTVEQLSAIQRTAKVGGHDFEGFVGQLGLMVKGLKAADDEGQKAAYAFKQLGIQTKDAFTGKIKDPAQIVQELAEKLELYRGSGNKVALVQDALGKGADKYIPLLKDMAEKTDALTTTTREQAKTAEEAEKNIRRLQLLFDDSRRELVQSYAQAIADFTEKLLLARQATGGLVSGGVLAGLDALMGSPEQIEARVRQLDAALAEVANNARVRERQGPSVTGFLSEQISGFNEAALRAEKQYLEAIRKAQAQRGAKDPNSPLFEFGGQAGLKDLNYESQDPAKVRARAAFVAKQIEEGDATFREELNKLNAFLDKLNEARANAILAAQATQRDQSAMVLRAQIYGTTDESDENKHPGIAARDARLSALRESLKNEQQLELEAHAVQMAQLEEYSDEELKALGGKLAAQQQLEQEHAVRLYQIRKSSLDRVGAINKTSWVGQTQTVLTEVIAMTSAVATHSRKLFEINKIAALANAALKTPEAVMSAYAFGAKFGGPPLGTAMAALALAAQTAQAAMIAGAQFGSSVTAPSVGGTPAPAVTPVSSQAQAPQQAQTTIIDFQGTTDERKLLRRFVDLLNENTADGGRILVRGSS